MILLESCKDVVQNLFKIDFTGRHIVSFAAVIRVVTQRLVGEKRCVTTLITAGKETRRHTDTQEMMFYSLSRDKMSNGSREIQYAKMN